MIEGGKEKSHHDQVPIVTHHTRWHRSCHLRQPEPSTGRECTGQGTRIKREMSRCTLHTDPKTRQAVWGRSQISDSYAGRACWSNENTPSTSEAHRNVLASRIGRQSWSRLDVLENPRIDWHFSRCCSLLHFLAFEL